MGSIPSGEPKEMRPAAADMPASRNMLHWSKHFTTPSPPSSKKLQSNQCRYIHQARHFFTRMPVNASHLYAWLQHLETAENMFSEEHSEVDNAPLQSFQVLPS